MPYELWFIRQSTAETKSPDIQGVSTVAHQAPLATVHCGWYTKDIKHGSIDSLYRNMQGIKAMAHQGP